MSDGNDSIIDLKDFANKALAKANTAAKGPWHIHEGDLVTADHQDVFTDWEEEDDHGNSIGPDTVFILTSQPTVCVLAHGVLDLQAALRVAVEALEKVQHEVGYSPARTIIRTALDEIKKLSGGQGER